ncbi:MAG TPA: class I SAM-dependent methyltransferase [Xanthobacteraceae bacterium]
MTTEQRSFWEKAGSEGYGTAYYSDNLAGAAIRARLFDVALELAEHVGIPRSGRVLDLGCGDGEFSNDLLSQRYGEVVGTDFSRTGISRAAGMRKSANVSFHVADLARDGLPDLGKFDGAFLIGILHHVKAQTADLLKQLCRVAPRIVVIEPNGAHLVRKLLELTPDYIAAGEDSFTHRTLKRLFAEAGYAVGTHCRFNIFPNFTPPWVYRIASPVEPLIEATPVLRGLCTLNGYGALAAPDVPSSRPRHAVP